MFPPIIFTGVVPEAARGLEARESFGPTYRFTDLGLWKNTHRLHTMLWTILIVLIVLWALGFGIGIAGNLIHLILVVALIVLIYQLITGRKV